MRSGGSAADTGQKDKIYLTTIGCAWYIQSCARSKQNLCEAIPRTQTSPHLTGGGLFFVTLKILFAPCIAFYRHFQKSSRDSIIYLAIYNRWYIILVDGKEQHNTTRHNNDGDTEKGDTQT